MIRAGAVPGCLALLVCALALGGCGRARAPAAAASPAQETAAPRSLDARPFPRTYPVDGKVYEVHQPQLDSWDGRTLKGRFALSVKTGTRTGADGKPEEMRDFGVVWFSAITQIDTGTRMVVLTDAVFERVSFPTALGQEADYLSTVRAIPGRGATWTMSLDHLESGLAVTATQAVRRHVANNPPEIIFSTEPAVLLMVDGAPVLRPVEPGIDRVINTRSLLLRRGNDFYTHMAGRWAQAPALIGPWTWVASVDASMESAMAKSAAKVETLEEPTPALKEDFASGAGPKLFVRTKPAELIVVQGDPMFVAIAGTSLAYIDNTGADVFVDGAGNWYVLVSGRWFGARSAQGPWTWIAPKKLPEDFRRIPPDDPKSNVLASIPGTPEARESVIANSLPQNATVSKDSVALDVPYDGEPHFVGIEGTALQYAKNSPVPVILVPGKGYWAVDKGVWFFAKAPAGPWEVATEVAPEIYSIPTSSPLHYVTYVQVYGSAGDEVYVGYTPGYYGTVVSDEDVVVYGTGYDCDPYVGQDDWYGCPATYGLGTYFGWNPYVGWTFGRGWGWYDGWFGPWDPWWGPWRDGFRGFASWRGGAAAWNVYDSWGNAAVRGTGAVWGDRVTGKLGRAARGAWANPRTGAVGAARAAVNANMDSGRAVAAAQGIRYDAGTGRVSRAAGIAAGAAHGAAGIAAWTSDGARTDAAAVAGFHYNRDTGELNRGGVASVNDSVYASRDGEVYKYSNGTWSKVNVPRDAALREAPARPAPRGVGSPKLGAGVGAQTPTAPGAITTPGVGGTSYGAGAGAPAYGAGVGADLDAQRYARTRGNQLSGGGNSSGGMGNSFQGQGNRYGGGGVGSPPPQPVGGYRSSLGASPARAGGGSRGGRR